MKGKSQSFVDLILKELQDFLRRYHYTLEHQLRHRLSLDMLYGLKRQGTDP